MNSECLQDVWMFFVVWYSCVLGFSEREVITTHTHTQSDFQKPSQIIAGRFVRIEDPLSHIAETTLTCFIWICCA